MDSWDTANLVLGCFCIVLSFLPTGYLISNNRYKRKLYLYSLLICVANIGMALGSLPEYLMDAVVEAGERRVLLLGGTLYYGAFTCLLFFFLQYFFEYEKDLDFLKSEHERDLEYLKAEHEKETSQLKKELEQAKAAIKEQANSVNEAELEAQKSQFEQTVESLKARHQQDLDALREEHKEETAHLREELEQAKKSLEKREIALNEAGSIAVAALQINGVFEAAQAASQQYIENIRSLSDRQAAICAQRDMENRVEVERKLKEAEEKCAAMEYASKRKCEAMEQEAKQKSEAYWTEVSRRLQSFYENHRELKRLLDFGTPGAQF